MVKKLPDWQRIRAEEHFLLLKEYEDTFVKKEMLLSGSKFRKCLALRKFCEIKGLSFSTFNRWRKYYKQYGIEGLIPSYWLISTPSLRTKHRAKRKQSGPITFVRLAIPANKPLACLSKLAKVIASMKSTTIEVKKSSLRALRFMLRLYVQRASMAITPPLTGEEKYQLRKYRIGKNKNCRIRATAIQMMNEHRPLIDIGMETGKSSQTIYRWVTQFNASRLQFVENKRYSPKRDEKISQRATRIVDIIHKQPSFYDINRTSWTLKAIALAYERTYGENISCSMISRIVKATGITWRHARKVWTSPDPLYREKIGKVIETLQNLQVGEAFFFIDEAGPCRVKKYGGKALAPNDERREIPETQKPKGSVQLIAALEALSNQVTWRFISSRSTRNIISMLDQLCSAYPLCSTLFVTWDDISCHSSHELKAWVVRHNSSVAESSDGPVISIVPLPSRAQFLNVIESVFGGMKKAVIYNSDYGSKKEMEMAIARHFEERNRFFQENPKRAGNKIWDKEAFDLNKLHGGLFKKM
jgi:transposase